jgi:hypothetical protein
MRTKRKREVMEVISVCVPASTISTKRTVQLSSLAGHPLMLQCNWSLRLRRLLEDNIKTMKIIVFRVVASCNVEERYKHFGKKLQRLPSGTVTVTVMRTENLNQHYDCIQENKQWGRKVEGTCTKLRLMTPFGRSSLESSASAVKSQ